MQSTRATATVLLVLLATTIAQAQGAKTKAEDFRIIAPPGLSANYLLLANVPIDLDGKGEKKVTAVVLLYELQQLPFRATLDQSTIVLKFKTTSPPLKASHVFVGAGSKLEAKGADPQYRQLTLKGNVASIAIASSGKEIPVTPSWSAALTEPPLKVELNRSPAFLWFIFPQLGDKQMDEIDEIDLPGIKLTTRGATPRR